MSKGKALNVMVIMIGVGYVEIRLEKGLVRVSMDTMDDIIFRYLMQRPVDRGNWLDKVTLNLDDFVEEHGE